MKMAIMRRGGAKLDVRGKLGEWVREINGTRMRAEPSAWARKYIIAASLSFFDCEIRIRGSRESRLSSKEVQVIRRLLDETTIRVLMVRRREKRNVCGSDLIMCTCGRRQGHRRGMSPVAYGV